MIHELRIYRCLPGRLARPAQAVRDASRWQLWERHGIRQAGFWTTIIGESNQELTYLLAWESLAERETKWAAFQSDPEWIAKRAETEKDGQIVANIVSQFLQPTSFSVGADEPACAGRSSPSPRCSRTAPCCGTTTPSAPGWSIPAATSRASAAPSRNSACRSSASC